MDLTGTGVDPYIMAVTRFRHILDRHNGASNDGEFEKVRDIEKGLKIMRRLQDVAHDFIQEFGHDVKDAQRKATEQPPSYTVTFSNRQEGL